MAHGARTSFRMKCLSPESTYGDANSSHPQFFFPALLKVPCHSEFPPAHQGRSPHPLSTPSHPLQSGEHERTASRHTHHGQASAVILAGGGLEPMWTEPRGHTRSCCCQTRPPKGSVTGFPDDE